VINSDLHADPERREEQKPARSRARQPAAALLGIATLAAGGAATFLSSNEAGSAGLVAGGTALLLVVLLGERLESLKVGNVEFHLREAARQLTRQAADLEARGDTEAAERLREEAQRLLLRASPAARAYEELRRTRPPGAQRVLELTKIADDAREYSRANHPSADAVRQIFSSGGDGERVYALALMQADPASGDVDCILDSISHSHSAFEQGQGLLAGLALLPRLGTADRGRLADAVKDQLRPDGHIARSTDRRHLAQQLLSELDG
jgi:hypothetical protein